MSHFQPASGACPGLLQEAGHTGKAASREKTLSREQAIIDHQLAFFCGLSITCPLRAACFGVFAGIIHGLHGDKFPLTSHNLTGGSWREPFLHLHGGLGQVGQGVATLELSVLDDTGVGVAGEVAGPLNEGAVLVLARGDSVAANGADDAGVRELGLGRDDAVRDVVVEGLYTGQVGERRVSCQPGERERAKTGKDGGRWAGRQALTLCSSCFTSSSVPSLKVHLTTSVSSWAWVASLLFRAVQKSAKFLTA